MSYTFSVLLDIVLEHRVWNVIDLKRLEALATQLRDRTLPATRGPQKSWYKIENQGTKAQIYLYDEIGEWGITARDFVQELDGLSATEIEMRVNSPGGNVFDGLAIYAALRRHPATVTARVEGVAASAASFISMAASRVLMEPNARMMIHDAQGLAIGDAASMTEMAALLDDTSNNIADIYAERSGGDRKTWRKAMKNTTWYNGEEAVAAGLADEVLGTEPQNRSNEGPPTSVWDPRMILTAIEEGLE